MEDDERSGCPRSHRTYENVGKVQNLVHSVNQAYYVEIFKWLCEPVQRKRPELWPNDWILHHCNAPVHKALSVKQFLAQNRLMEWNTYPRLLIWIQMISVSKNKVCLNEAKISGY
jgi:hypothetical protein